MKLSLPDAVAVLDEFVHSMALPSRFAAIRHAIRMLRHAGLRRDYAAAWEE